MDATTISARSTLAYTLAEIAHEHSFSHYLAATFPQADKVNLKTNLIVSNWPMPLLEDYKAMDVFWDSRLLDALKRTIVPVLSASTGFARQNGRDTSGAVQAIFNQAGLNATLALSLHDAERRPYIVLFSGSAASNAETEHAAILYKSAKALDAYTSSIPSSSPSREQLTARELDCLRWSAAGKSSEEIAMILDISIHTVNTHLKSAMRKLESANRMQAVAIACRLRLI